MNRLDTRRRLALASIALLCVAHASSADEVAEKSVWAQAGRRPTIALVLSGGGARGASHIGVLQVFEEMRIPIDYVTGNSMGAIVGGYYAVGYSPDQLEAEITSVDWIDIFRDLPARQDLPFRRKQDTRDFRVQMRLGFDRYGFHFPIGLVQGQKLELLLQRLGMNVWDVRNFDDLPLPFRSVATDIETGKAVILSGGYLPTAIHASMAVPGAFAPVEIGDRLLVDGMLSNNIPIDAALAFDPDVVIAVDIGTQPLSREQITSAFSVSAQTLSLLMQGGTEHQLALLRPSDLLLKPDLSGISTADFPKVAEAIERGRRAASERAADFAHLSVDEAEWASYLARQRMRPRPTPQIESIRVTSDSGLSPKVLLSRLKVRPNQQLDVSKLERDLQKIYGMDIFENVRFRLEPEGDGARLEIDAIQKSWGTNHLRFKIEFEEDFEETHDYNVGFQMTAMPVNGYGAEWRNEFQFGSDLRIFSEFYQPITASSQWFIAPTVEYETPQINVFQGGRAVGTYRVRTTIVKLDVGRQIGGWAEIRAGFGYLDQRASISIGDPSFPTGRFGSGAYFARFTVDTVDNVSFPTRGVQGAVRFAGAEEALGADESFQQLSAVLSASKTWRHWTVTGVGALSTHFGDVAPGAVNQLGGFLRLSGVRQGAVSGPDSLFGSVILYRQIAAPSFFNFRVPVYLGGSFEVGGAWDDWDELNGDSLIYAGSVFLGSDTPFGPVYLAYGGATGDNHAGYLVIGRVF